MKLIYLAFLFSSLFSYGQSKLTGKITDAQHEPIEFANVFLTDANHKLIKGGITNKKGQFQLTAKKGNYTLTVSFVGYSDYKKEIPLDKNKNLGNIILKETADKLKGVVVTAKKRLIEQKVDRLVFNVENSIVSKGMDALDVLRRTPRIEVSDQSIKIIGKSTLNVLIDGRMLHLSGRDLTTYLKGLRSDNISKIEVITIPPAKYDAQGNSGLINIITKKNLNLGWDGSVGTTYNQRTYAAFMPTGKVKFATKKVNITLNISTDIEKRKSISNSKVAYETSIWNVSNNRKDFSKGLSLNLNSNYIINKKSDVGFIYGFSFWDTESNGSSLSKFIQKEPFLLDSILTTSTRKGDKEPFNAINGYYDLKLDNKGKKKLSVNIDYLQKNTQSDLNLNAIRQLKNSPHSNSNISKLYNGDGAYSVLSLKTDFILPYPIFNLNVGGKLTFINNNSNLSYYDIASGVSTINWDETNQFDYKERTNALYFSIEKAFGKKWNTKLGFRYENTYLKGYSLTLNQKHTNSLNNIFPSAYLSYNPNENYSFSIAYSKRIERPVFYLLNPFKLYSDAYSYDTGNPFLNPSFTHNLELSFIYKNNLSLTASASKFIDIIDFITITSTNAGSIVSKPENLFNEYNYNLDISYNFTPTNWFNSYNSVSAYFNKSDSNFTNQSLNSYKGYGSYISTKNTFTLNKTTFITANFFQSFPNVDGFSEYGNKASLNLGLRFSLLDNNL